MIEDQVLNFFSGWAADGLSAATPRGARRAPAGYPLQTLPRELRCRFQAARPFDSTSNQFLHGIHHIVDVDQCIVNVRRKTNSS